MSPEVSLLAEVPLFQLLDADERSALAKLMEHARFPAGHRIFQEGEPGDRMYVICSGVVELATTDKLGQKLILATAGRGDLFGELALLDHGGRTARATVLEESELLVLDRATLIDFIRRRPDAALDMMAVMSGRMRATTSRLRQMATRNANEEMETKVTALERITDAIEAKMAQQQLDEEYQYRLSIAKKEADRKRIESEGLKAYNDTVNSSLNPSVLTWQGIQATLDLAKSQNAKVVVVGSGKDGLPLILKTD